MIFIELFIEFPVFISQRSKLSPGGSKSLIHVDRFIPKGRLLRQRFHVTLIILIREGSKRHPTWRPSIPLTSIQKTTRNFVWIEFNVIPGGYNFVHLLYD